MDRKNFEVTYTIVEDERFVNLVGSRTIQQMQLITIRNEKIKTSCHEVTEHASTGKVNVNLKSYQTFGELELELL